MVVVVRGSGYMVVIRGGAVDVLVVVDMDVVVDVVVVVRGGRWGWW